MPGNDTHHCLGSAEPCIRHGRDCLSRSRHPADRAIPEAVNRQAGIAGVTRPPATTDDEVSDHTGNWQLPPERLGGPELPKKLRPALIVFPNIEAEHDGVEVIPVSPARAAFVLGEQSSAMWAIEPRPLAALARLVTSVLAFQVSYGNAFDAAPVIVELLNDSPSGNPAQLLLHESHPDRDGRAATRRRCRRDCP